MAALMSHILTSARMKSVTSETPLDLTWTLHTSTTCDSLIAQEPLRTEPDISEDEDEYQDRNKQLNEKQQVRVDQCLSYRNSDKQNACNVKPKVHPFSIAALIGNMESSDSSAPAQVFSHSMNTRVQTNKYCLNDLSDQSVSEIRNVFWCHVCNTICDGEHGAYRHRFVHSIRKDTCNLRREVLKQNGHVTCHKMVDKENITCGICEKEVLMCFFHKHQRLHDGHFCAICGQDFSNNSRLEDHMNIHTGSTPFSCHICDRKFAKRSSLMQHQRYHRNHKSFTCRFCRKSFNSKYACAVHERLHTGDNPFKCPFPGCTRAYPQKIQLKLHINSHHRN